MNDPWMDTLMRSCRKESVLNDNEIMEKSSFKYREFKNLKESAKKSMTLEVETSAHGSLCGVRTSIQKPGSLRVVFEYFTKIVDPRGITYDDIRRSNESVDISKFLIFCSSYGLMPNYISQAGVLFICQRQRLYLGDGTSYFDFENFMVLLCRVAMLSFHQILNPAERVTELIRLLELDNIERQREILGKIQQSRSGKGRPTFRLQLRQNDFGVATHQQFSALNMSFDVSMVQQLQKFNYIEELATWENGAKDNIDMGSLPTNQSFQFKIQLRNRMSYQISMDPCLYNLKGATLTFDSRRLAPGLVTELVLTVRMPDPIEVVGEVQIRVLDPDDKRLEIVSIPVYGNFQDTKKQSRQPHVLPAIKQVRRNEATPVASDSDSVLSRKSLSTQRYLLAGKLEKQRGVLSKNSNIL